MPASKLTVPVQEAIVHTISFGGSDEQAWTAAGISRTTFYSWLAKGREPDAPAEYRDLAEEVALARRRRPDVILTGLADETDWKARAKYLEILEARARRTANEDLHRDKLRAEARKLEAEADLAEQRLEAAKKGGAGLLLMPEEVLALLPEAARVQFHAMLAAVGVGVVVERNLTGGVTAEDIAAACPAGTLEGDLP